MNIVKLFFELTKFKITFAVMLTTIVGYALAANSLDIDMIIPVLGLLILAMGSAVLNQYQEYELDGKMERTMNRPIPSGRISASNALLISFIMIFIGSILLFFFSGFDALWLGLLALIWYNAIYTPMKRRTPFAVIPGSLIGALPPLVGWVGGGGALMDWRALVLAFFFFIWQVPHFWLLMIKYGEQYEAGGFPSLQRFYSEKHIRWVTFLWTVSTAIAALMLPAFKVIKSEITAIGIVTISTWLIFSFVRLLKFDEKPDFKPMPYFMKINIFVLLMIILLSVDNFWGIEFLI